MLSIANVGLLMCTTFIIVNVLNGIPASAYIAAFIVIAALKK